MFQESQFFDVLPKHCTRGYDCMIYRPLWAIHICYLCDQWFEDVTVTTLRNQTNVHTMQKHKAKNSSSNFWKPELYVDWNWFQIFKNLYVERKLK